MIAALLVPLFFAVPKLPAVVGLDGRQHNVAIEAKGRPFALVFISHDCPVCNTYAPELARIAHDYRGKVGLTCVYAEPNLTRAEAISHAAAYHLQGAELLLDPRATLARACQATITPQAVVFDRNGRRIYSGRIDDLYYDLGKQRPAVLHHDLRNALDAALAGKAATPAGGPPFGCVIQY